MMSDSLLRSAAKSYGFDKSTCKFITYGRESEKQLYTFVLKDKQYVLRLIEKPQDYTKHESEVDWIKFEPPVDYIGQTLAEMEWLQYLSENGATVPTPLRTQKSEMVFSIEEKGKYYIVSAFSMMKGQQWDKENADLWNKRVLYNWGKAVGKIHRLSKDFVPANSLNRRGEFKIGGMINEKIKEYSLHSRVSEKLLKEIEALPKEKDSFGLIQGDLNPNNLLIDGDSINLFDFDDCVYSWYAFDIGNALYISLWLGRKNNVGFDFTNIIIESFIKGYLSENILDDFWLSKIPLFMMSCKLALFSLGCDSEEPSLMLTDASTKEQIYNIENGILFGDSKIDYSLFKK